MSPSVICTYRVREYRFRDLLGGVCGTLHTLGFGTDEEALVFRGMDGGLTYVEIYTWVEGGFGRRTSIPACSRYGRRWIRCSKTVMGIASGSFRTSRG